MRYWSRPRKLNDSARTDLAAVLRAAADQLDAPHAGRVQDLLAVEADPTWPTATSGAGHGGGSGSGPTSPVESTALHRSPDAHRAADVLVELHQLDRLARRILAALLDRHPGRAVKLCGACSYPLDRQFDRCQRIIDGVQCGARAGTERRCKTCHEVQPVGKPLRNGDCDRCRKKLERDKRRRFTAGSLARDAELLTPDGTYHSDE